VRRASRPGRLPVPGGTLAYETAGDGPAIVWVHSGIADRRMWDREFARYADGSTVVRYDLRGFGKSTPATAPYSDAGDLAALSDHLSLGPAVVVGCSLGGRIAIDFALARPESVRGLVLLAPEVSGWAPESESEGRAEFARDGARFAELSAAWSDGRAAEAIAGLQEWKGSAFSGDPVALVRRMIRENATEIFTEASGRHRRPAEPPALGRLGSISLPTYVLLGDQGDPSAGIVARRVSREIPGARLGEVRGADHFLNLSRPDAFDLAFQEHLFDLLA
jgi:pimeloyl-ACP methyl ester carboxylesterase